MRVAKDLTFRYLTTIYALLSLAARVLAFFLSPSPPLLSPSLPPSSLSLSLSPPTPPHLPLSLFARNSAFAKELPKAGNSAFAKELVIYIFGHCRSLLTL